MSALPAIDGNGRPTGAEAISSVESLARTATNDAGQVISQDAYFDLSGLTYSAATLTLGTEGVNYHRTRYGYDTLGRPSRTETATGTIYRTVYDAPGRVVSEWVGTDDVPTSGSWSPSNNAGADMVKVASYEYDGGSTGPGLLTKATAHPGGSEADRVTEYHYDWRYRLVAQKQGVQTSESTSVHRPIFYFEYDNLDRVVMSERYTGDGVTITDGDADGVPDAPSASLRRARSTFAYDEQGRVYDTRLFSVNRATGNVFSTGLSTQTWYDNRGLVLKTSEPNGLVTKFEYDGAGRSVASYVTDGGGDTTWAHAADVAGDVVLEQAEFDHADDGRVLSVTTRSRFHDETGTGALGTLTTGVKARVSYYPGMKEAHSGTGAAY